MIARDRSKLGRLASSTAGVAVVLIVLVAAAWAFGLFATTSAPSPLAPLDTPDEPFEVESETSAGPVPAIRVRHIEGTDTDESSDARTEPARPRGADLYLRVVDPSGRRTPSIVRVRRNDAMNCQDAQLRAVFMKPGVEAVLRKLEPRAYVVEVFKAHESMAEASESALLAFVERKNALPKESRPLDLEDGRDRRLLLHLPAMAGLELTLTKNGTPLQSGTVNLYKGIDASKFMDEKVAATAKSMAADAVLVASRTIRGPGSVRFDDLTPGKRRLEVRVGTHETAHWFDIEVSTGVASRRIALDLCTATLEVRFEGGRDEDLQNAVLVSLPRRTRRHRTIPVGGARKLVLDDIACGSHDFELEGSDGAILAKVSVPVGRAERKEVTMKVAGREIVRIEVKDRVGTPMLAFVRVRAEGSDTHKDQRIVRGKGSLELAPGRYYLSVRSIPAHPEYGPERRIDLVVGFPQDLVFDLR